MSARLVDAGAVDVAVVTGAEVCEHLVDPFEP
jgi:hypothetical protein